MASALAGGDCIDDADALRSGGTARVLGSTVKAPSTLGTFLRSFRWGHVRQLDRVSRELLAQAWAAGAGPGDGPLTIDLDSTICETYGLAKEGARRHGYTGQRGYHPLLAVAAGTGEVLMARLREGRANTARGAAHFLRETVGRVRYAGATGRLMVRADSGFYNHAIVAVCRKVKVRFSITVRQHQSLRNLIWAIPEADWRPIPYWMEGAADVAEINYTPFKGEPDAVPVRLIVRRVRPTTWPAGPGASPWKRQWQPPRPSGAASSHWPDASPARRAASPSSPQGLALGNPVQLGPGPIARPATPILTTPWVSARRVDYPTAWRMPAGSNPCVSCSLCPDHLAHRRHLGPPTYQTHHCRTSRLTISTAVENSLSLALASHPLSIRHGRVLSVDSG